MEMVHFLTAVSYTTLKLHVHVKSNNYKANICYQIAQISLPVQYSNWWPHANFNAELYKILTIKIIKENKLIFMTFILNDVRTNF